MGQFRPHKARFTCISPVKASTPGWAASHSSAAPLFAADLTVDRLLPPFSKASSNTKSTPHRVSFQAALDGELAPLRRRPRTYAPRPRPPARRLRPRLPPRPEFPVKKQTVLITGASSGIGKATALRFQAAGWNVAAKRRPPAQSELPGLTLLPLDVTDPASIEAAIAEAERLLGPFEAAIDEQIRRQS